jgi:hypothetical protein
VSKGARFWGFLFSRVRGVVGGFSSIPLNLASFGGPNLGYGVPMRCSYYPKVLCKSVERFGRLGVGFEGVDLRALLIPSYPSCSSEKRFREACLVGFALGERLGVFPIISYCCCFSFFCFGAR